MVATQQFAPAGQTVGLALQQSPADNAITAQQDAGDVFEVIIAVIGCRGFAQQGPASGVVHAAEQRTAPTARATALTFTGRGDQCTQAGEAVGADQAGRDQRLQRVFQLTG
ncbi:hypothetical protein D3C78_1115720 [compost metagenome]